MEDAMCREISQYQKKLEELQKSPNTVAKRNINAINACYFSAASKNKGIGTRHIHASLKEVQFIKAQLFSAGNLELCSVSSVKLTYFWTKKCTQYKKGYLSKSILLCHSFTLLQICSMLILCSLLCF